MRSRATMEVRLDPADNQESESLLPQKEEKTPEKTVSKPKSPLPRPWDTFDILIVISSLLDIYTSIHLLIIFFQKEWTIAWIISSLTIPFSMIFESAISSKHDFKFTQGPGSIWLRGSERQKTCKLGPLAQARIACPLFLPPPTPHAHFVKQ